MPGMAKRLFKRQHTDIGFSRLSTFFHQLAKKESNSNSSLDSEEEASAKVRQSTRVRRVTVTAAKDQGDANASPPDSPLSYSEEVRQHRKECAGTLDRSTKRANSTRCARHPLRRNTLNASSNSIDTIISADVSAANANANTNTKASTSENANANGENPSTSCTQDDQYGEENDRVCAMSQCSRADAESRKKQRFGQKSGGALKLGSSFTRTNTNTNTNSTNSESNDTTTAPNDSSMAAKPRRILRKMATDAEMTQYSFTKRPSRITMMKSKQTVKCPLTEALCAIKPSFFKDTKLASYKNEHWTTVLQEIVSERGVPQSNGASEIAVNSQSQESGRFISFSSSSSSSTGTTTTLSRFKITEQERRRREAVWELFVSELVFLVDHLMVLKHAYIEPLKKVQVDGFLMFAEPQELFGNADELCYVSYTFCRDFMHLLHESAVGHFCSTQNVTHALNGWMKHSRVGEVYHDYCLNYYAAINYLEEMRRHEEFCEYERWCQADERCRRLQLTDLLAAPMQHCTKIPLLIANLIKYTDDAQEKADLHAIMLRIQDSLQQLDEKIKRLFNFERLQQLQKQTQWPSVMEMNPSCYVPNKLKDGLSRQPCVELLANPRRTLLKEGPVSLIESEKRLDLYIFLFDDVLLLTKCKKKPPKKSAMSLNKSPTDGWQFKVYKQPIPLDRVHILEIEKPENNLEKHAWVIIHTTRFRQIIGAYTLQAANDATKLAWIAFIQKAQNVMQQNLSLELSNGNSVSTLDLLSPLGGCSGDPGCGVSWSSLLSEQDEETCDVDTPVADRRGTIDSVDSLSVAASSCTDCPVDYAVPKKEARRNAIDLTSERANLLDSPDSATPHCLELPKRSNLPFKTESVFPTFASRKTSVTAPVPSASTISAALTVSDSTAITANLPFRFCLPPGKQPHNLSVSTNINISVNTNINSNSSTSPSYQGVEAENTSNLENSTCSESGAFKPLATPSSHVSTMGMGIESNSVPVRGLSSLSSLSAIEESCMPSKLNGDKIFDEVTKAIKYSCSLSCETDTDCTNSPTKAALPKKKTSLDETPANAAAKRRPLSVLGSLIKPRHFTSQCSATISSAPHQPKHPLLAVIKSIDANHVDIHGHMMRDELHEDQVSDDEENR